MAFQKSYRLEIYFQYLMACYSSTTWRMTSKLLSLVDALFPNSHN